MDSKLILQSVLQRHSKYKKTIPYFQKEAEDIITELSKELDLPKEIIRSVVVSQFRFIRDIVLQCKSPDHEEFDIEKYKSIRLQFLGRFEPKKVFKNKYKCNEHNNRTSV